MENDTITLTECDAITSFNNFKKFYNAFRKINNIKIKRTIILEFLYKLLNSKHNNRTYNEFQIFSNDFKRQFMEKCKENEIETMKIYETYFKEHVGHKFIDFLKTHKVLDAYKDNLKEQMNETLLGRILFSYPSNYIDSFLWSETKQGFGYWDYFHREWMDIVAEDGERTQFTQEYFKQIRKIIGEYKE